MKFEKYSVNLHEVLQENVLVLQLVGLNVSYELKL